MTLEERYTNLSHEIIRRWIAGREGESVRLDFKEVRDKSFSERENRKTLAKLISGSPIQRVVSLFGVSAQQRMLREPTTPLLRRL